MAEPFAELLHLGRGVTRPFRRDGRGDFATATGAALVSAAVGQILGTIADSAVNVGELPWRPDFGSKLHLLRHSPNNEALVETARVFVIEAVQRWEPRVRISNVEISRDETEGSGGNKLTIRLRYAFVELQTGVAIFEDLETAVVV